MADRVGYIGLGSNQGDRRGHLRAAIQRLGESGVEVEAVSGVYETAPVGEYDGPQPDFLNLVVAIRTSIEAEPLLDVCKRIEAERGRDFEGPRHGPRPLDADILLLGELELASERLTIPHAGLRSRRFVLEPLAELAPDLAFPGGGEVAGDLERAGAQRVEPRGPLG